MPLTTAKQKGTSLANRLFLSAAAWVFVILIVTGFVLSSVYRQAVERSFDRRLNLYLRTLIAEAESAGVTEPKMIARSQLRRCRPRSS